MDMHTRQCTPRLDSSSVPGRFGNETLQKVALYLESSLLSFRVVSGSGSERESDAERMAKFAANFWVRSHSRGGR